MAGIYTIVMAACAVYPQYFVLIYLHLALEKYYTDFQQSHHQGYVMMKERAYALPLDIKNMTEKGLVIGAYNTEYFGEYKLTATGCKVNEESGGTIMKNLKGTDLNKMGAVLISDICPDFHTVAVAALGADDAGCNDFECLDESKENCRVAAGVGAKALQDRDIGLIMVEGFTSSEAAAEGASLATWRFQELKSKDTWATESELELYDDPDCQGWRNGLQLADAQNLARKLEETPANIMTPSRFAQMAISILCPCGVHVDVRDKGWMDTQKMCGFLSVAKGSSQSPLLLEMSYCGGDEGDKPVVLVGKGVTFDTGGINPKNRKKVVENCSLGMAGAAVVIGVLKGLAALKIPINVNALIPLCENMPGGMALKPGDVVMSLCGKTILVERTDNEGEVMLADVLSFTAAYKPCLVINVASLNHGMEYALGAPASGAFCTSNAVWMELIRAAADTGDRVWRLPLWKAYTNYVITHRAVDVSNVGVFPGGDPCTAAAFLREFAPCADFIHLDITGSGGPYRDNSTPYLRHGLMTGRPTRTIIQFLYQMACPNDAKRVAQMGI